MVVVEEEEAAAEVEALQAVYGDDCTIMETNPPHLHLRLIPRTADLTSQQFVEAIIEVRAGSQYPEEPPRIDLIDSKGLDEQRQKLLLNCVRDRAIELTSCLMLVALCEEAVERLSSMNHPDGDCPLCLCPLVQENEPNKTLPFMKLMSCFHCFHCECIIRWWNWLQTEENTNRGSSSSSTHSIIHNENEKGLINCCFETDGVPDDSIGNCPVCRKVFHTKDFKHVLDLVGSLSFQSIPDEIEAEDSEKLLYSDSENIRRQRFEDTLKLQEENNGLIEPKRDVSVLPGMYLPQSVTPATVATKESEEQQRESPLTSEVRTSTSSERPGTSKQRNHGPRKARLRYHRKPVKQWIQKEDSST